MWYTQMTSPVGSLMLAADEEGLRYLAFANSRVKPQKDWQNDAEPFAETIDQLRTYFAGATVRFTCRVKPEGTPFRRRIWSALQKVKHGQTLSYGQLAEQAGRPGAGRAVGGAVGANPISIIIPCHRIVGADGSMTGFGGGLKRKKQLLGLEGVMV